MSKITVRPRIINGESLSGYLIRISKYNGIEPNKLFKSICSELNMDMNIIRGWSTVANRLDLYPSLFIDKDKLAFILGIEINQLGKMTLSIFYDKFLDQPITYKAISDSGVFRLKRHFCPSCLKEEGIYKLIWQIKNVEVCDKHLIKIRTKCPCCNKEQPYITNKLAEFKCIYCDALLYDTEFNNMGKEEERDTLDWEYLLYSNTPILKNINGFNKDETLKLLSLFITQSKNNIYKPELNKFIDKSYKYKWISSLKGKNGQNKIKISFFINLIKNLRMSIADVQNIIIPETYINSLCKEKNASDKLGPCLSPWCKNYGNNNSIRQIRNKKYHHNTHSLSSVCEQCFMTFGYNKKNQEWEGINNKFNVYLPKVRNLVQAGMNNYKIRNELKLGNEDLCLFNAYLINHRLLSKNIINKFDIPEIPNDIIEYFKKLINTQGKMNRNSKKLFGWGRFQYYYYFTSSKVQQFLLLETSGTTLRNNSASGYKKTYWEQELEKTLEYLLREDKDICYKEIIRNLGCSEGTIHKHGLGERIKEVKKIQNKKKMHEYEKIIKDKVICYIQKVGMSNGKISYKDIYLNIGLNYKWINRNIPELNLFIMQQITEYEQTRNLRLLDDLKKSIEITILKNYINGMKLTIRDISRLLNINENYIYKNIELKFHILNFQSKLYDGFL